MVSYTLKVAIWILRMRARRYLFSARYLYIFCPPAPPSLAVSCQKTFAFSLQRAVRFSLHCDRRGKRGAHLQIVEHYKANNENLQTPPGTYLPNFTVKWSGWSKHPSTIKSEYHTSPLCLNITHHHPIPGTRMYARYKRKKWNTQYASLYRTLELAPSFCFQLEMIISVTHNWGWVHSNDCPFIALPFAALITYLRCTGERCAVHSTQWCQTVHSEIQHTLW